MQINTCNITELMVEDPQTDPRLLPWAWRCSDNSHKRKHYKVAVKKAIKNCLTTVQQEQLELFYGKELTKTEIARRQNKSCAAVSKSMKMGEDAIRAYVEQYMEIYDDLQQEWLRQDGE